MTYIGCEERETQRDRRRERERRREGGWGGWRDSFYISKCLLGSECTFAWGGRVGTKATRRVFRWGVDNAKEGKENEGEKMETGSKIKRFPSLFLSMHFCASFIYSRRSQRST